MRDRLVMAHRGGGLEAPENTWSALEHTDALGLDWLETDIRSSADGVPVLAHDSELPVSAGADGEICDFQWQELEWLNAGDGNTFPRLRDALETYPNLHFNIDIKDAHALVPTVQAVEAAGALGRVRFASFSSRRLAQVHELLPQAKFSLGMRDVAALMGVAELGLSLPRLQRYWRAEQVDAVQVPERMHGVPVVTKRFVAAAHQHELAVHVWTVDEPTQMRRLLDLGVDGIITDRPTVALKTVAQWRETR